MRHGSLASYFFYVHALISTAPFIVLPRPKHPKHFQFWSFAGGKAWFFCNGNVGNTKFKVKIEKPKNPKMCEHWLLPAFILENHFSCLVRNICRCRLSTKVYKLHWKAHFFKKKVAAVPLSENCFLSFFCVKINAYQRCFCTYSILVCWKVTLFSFFSRWLLASDGVKDDCWVAG